MLRANHFQISMPRGHIHHYMVSIQPDKCPRKVNRDIIETMVHAYSKIFGTKKPVFDGRSNLYTRDPLPIGNEPVELEVTLPGEGKDRVFRVSVKWVAQVSLYALEEALEGRTRVIPFDAIQASATTSFISDFGQTVYELSRTSGSISCSGPKIIRPLFVSGIGRGDETLAKHDVHPGGT